jgi:hypothetical protein
MSRYVLQTIENRTVVVGWDNPLQSFFCQDFKNYNTLEEELIWDIGNKYGECPDPDSFIKTIEENGYYVSYDVCVALYMDFAGRKGLTPLQENLKKMFDEVMGKSIV